MNTDYLVDKLSGEDGHLKNEPKLLPRGLKDIIPTTEDIKPHNVIRVLTWNILADALSVTAEFVFTKCPPEALLWETRRFRVLEEILTHKPDIVCLQECDHYDDFISPALGSVSFLGAFVPKAGGAQGRQLQKGIPTADGCCICYHEEKFKPIKTETLSLRGEENKETNQVAILNILRVLGADNTATGPEFCVVTTHLKAKPEFASERAEQARYLLKEIKSKIGSNMPLIICGDFNGPPTEEVYKVMSSSDLKLTSAYTKLGTGLEEPEFTTWKIRNDTEYKQTIDYIWYSTDKFTVKSLLQLPTAEALGDGKLPSKSYPSDHCSLMAELVFAQ